MTTTRGQHLIGKEIGSCILEKLLGYGGSSAVFLARSLTPDEHNGEQVAVKVFLPRSTMDGQTRRSFYRRFLREAEAASQLDHPNILSIYSYGEHEGLPYIVMPYMPGGTLAEYVQKHGQLSLQEALHYLRQVAEALDYAHEHGCVHCDVKPANILLDGSGQATLSDFGIVRLLQEDAVAAQSTSKSPEVLMGTPDYISPEQALGEKLDGRSDIYSLGVTLYYLLAGGPPFKAESSIAVALMHVHEAPPLLGLRRVDITPQIDFVIGKALSKWPQDRFQTGSAFCAAFAAAVEASEDARRFSFTNELPAKGVMSLQSSGYTTRRMVEPPPAVIQVKPVEPPRPRLSRTSLSVLLALALVLSSALVAGIYQVVEGAIAQRSHAQENILAGTPRGPVDDLANDQGGWPVGSSFFFQNGQYHILNTSPSRTATIFYSSYTFVNFHLSVTMSEVRGSRDGGDYYGVVFRASNDQSRYYLLEVVAWAGGQYGFLRYDAGGWTTLAVGNVPDMLVAPGQSNVVTIEATKNRFTFFINNQQLGKPVVDTSRAAMLSGLVGLMVEEQNTEIAFSHLYITRA